MFRQFFCCRDVAGNVSTVAFHIDEIVVLRHSLVVRNRKNKDN